MRKMFYIGVDLSGFFALAFPDEEDWRGPSTFLDF